MIGIDIDDLITRLEAATGADRSLDSTLWHLHYGGSGDGPAFPPRYTDSLDAARTLVPPQLWCVSGSGRTRPSEPLFGAAVFNPVIGEEPDRLAAAEHEHSEAIAVCIAALKARAEVTRVTSEDHTDVR